MLSEETHTQSQITGPTEPIPELTGPTTTPPLLSAPPEPPNRTSEGTGDSGKGGRGRLWRIIIILLLVFGALLLIGLLPRLFRQPQINRDAKAQTNAVPKVSVTTSQAPPPFDDLDLPGNIQAIQQTAVVARASGYVSRLYADIGDQVQAGQLLATIATPDLDQSVAQARAQLAGSQAAYSQAQANLSNLQANVAQADANLSRSDATWQQSITDLARSRAALAQAQEAAAQQRAQLTQAQANLNLARVTAQRYQNLLADGAIDQQTTDQAVASLQTNQANVQALASALRASEANTQAFRAAVLSSQANVQAYLDGVRASRAGVGAAEASASAGRANVVAAATNIQSNAANLARNVSLQAFQKVTAPFSGVITARNIDNGALISTSGGAASGSSDSSSVGGGSAGATSLGNAAGGSATVSGSSPGGASTGSSGSSTSLFSIAQIGVLRLYISVPQAYLSSIHVGQTAKIQVKELPGRTVLGHVTRTAGALDAASRTLVVEVQINNSDGALRPGMFAQVQLHVPHPGSAVLMPDAALVTNAAGTQVILVGQDKKLHFQPITVGRDFGQVIEVTSGLQSGQQIVSNPSDNLMEGETVQTTPAPKQSP